MNIKRNGSQASYPGPAEWFTGSVRVDPLFEAPEPAQIRGSSVTYEPAAQCLAYASAGAGADRYGGQRSRAAMGWSRRGGQSRRRSLVAPGEKHWHGATPSTAMSCIVVMEAVDDKVVEWLEHVTDEQYQA